MIVKAEDSRGILGGVRTRPWVPVHGSLGAFAVSQENDGRGPLRSCISIRE